MSVLPEFFTLEVVTPERLVVREEVLEAQIPARGGFIGVLPGHAPLLSELEMGELSYRMGTITYYLSVTWGFVEVLPERVIVLAEKGERAEEIDVPRAEAARQRAEDRLKRTGDPDIDFLRASVALRRALIRLQVSQKATGSFVPPPREHGTTARH